MQAPAKKNILIIGAGFAGLTLAALLQKKNIFNIVVFEKAEPGGLLQSENFENVLIEGAAPSLLNHSRFEEFAASYGVTLQKPLKTSRKRFIFYNGLTRWPLSVFETLSFILQAVKFFFLPEKLGTLPGLTVEAWSLRHFGKAFTDKVLRPALFGIYASDPRELDAELVLARFFSNEKKDRPVFRGSTIPKGGLSNFLKFLKSDLVKNEVQFVKKNLLQEELLRLQNDYIVVFATGFKDFVNLVKKDPAAFLTTDDSNWRELTDKIRLISLVKVHLFFENVAAKLLGFGALFHPDFNFNSLGVISNSCVFPEYAGRYNEAWILKSGGAEEALADRARLFQDSTIPVNVFVKTHADAYPLYNEDLKTWIKATRFRERIYGTGNFWGQLGLTQIFLKNLNLVEQITSDSQK